MNLLHERYERETGRKPMYRKNGADFHTLRYVTWLEGLLVRKFEAQQEDSADEKVVCPECGCRHAPGNNTLCHR